MLSAFPLNFVLILKRLVLIKISVISQTDLKNKSNKNAFLKKFVAFLIQRPIILPPVLLLRACLPQMTLSKVLWCFHCCLSLIFSWLTGLLLFTGRFRFTLIFVQNSTLIFPLLFLTLLRDKPIPELHRLAFPLWVDFRLGRSQIISVARNFGLLDGSGILRRVSRLFFHSGEFGEHLGVFLGGLLEAQSDTFDSAVFFG